MTLSGLRAGVRATLPVGKTLPEHRWRQRHRAMLGLLLGFGPALFAFALLQGFGAAHSGADAALPLVCGVLALAAGSRHRRLAAVGVALGLMTASGVAIHLAHGATEAHFLFFILIGVLALYEDWLPFLVAFGYVVVHHTLMGMMDPGSVYDHADAVAHPFKWALIHGAFVSASGIANVVSWRVNEAVRADEAHALLRARESESELSDVFENAPSGMAVLDHKGRFTRVNAALGAVLGRAPAALVGEPVDTVLEPGQLDALAAVWTGEHARWNGELLCRHASGQTVFGEVGLTLRRDAAGRANHAILQVIDITERRRAEQARDRMELELRLNQKLEAVGELAAGIAHEINTPIQFIGDTLRFVDEAVTDLLTLSDRHGALCARAETDGVFAELTAGVRATEEEIDLAYLRERLPAAFVRTTDGVERVTTIVRALLEFAHPPTAFKTPVDLNQSISNALVVATNSWKYVADVETDLGDLPPVICNAGDINQVLLNLVVNAAQAVEDAVGDTGGRGTIRIRTADEGDHVTVDIADTGTGIPPDVAPRIFDPFFTTKDVGRGTGQGLSIARSIITERHAGTLSFETVPGSGTTFRVRLPVAA